jgi:hypothetical protein
MPAAADVLSVLHLLLLSAFVGGTSVAMLVALIQRLRVTRPVLVWRTGPITGMPLGPLLFLVLVGAGLGGATWMGQSVPPSAWIGYPAGGLFWFVATWLARSIVVTEYGIIHDVTRIHRAVAWNQVVDYFETTRGRQPHVVFFYRDHDGTRSRLDLPVAAAQVEAFRALVQQKLDARLQLSPEQAFDEETLDELDGP